MHNTQYTMHNAQCTMHNAQGSYCHPFLLWMCSWRVFPIVTQERLLRHFPRPDQPTNTNTTTNTKTHHHCNSNPLTLANDFYLYMHKYLSSWCNWGFCDQLQDMSNRCERELTADNDVWYNCPIIKGLLQYWFFQNQIICCQFLSQIDITNIKKSGYLWPLRYLVTVMRTQDLNYQTKIK